MPKKLPPFPDPAELPQLQQLVRGAVRIQHGSITQKQFINLLRHLLDAQELSSPIWGWFYANRGRLKAVLGWSGVSVRPTAHPRPRPAGFEEFAKIEAKLEQQRKRRKHALFQNTNK